jgi:hypothetical protein
MRSSRAVVERSSAPAAHKAVYSPSECPATKSALSASRMPPSRSSTRSTAMALAMIAGWALAVSCSWSSGPSHISLNSDWPSASSTSWNASRAWTLAAASAWPMPTAWLP